MEDIREKIHSLLYIMVAIVFIAALVGVPQNIINLFVELFTKYVIVSTITSFVAGNLVESFSGDLLKKYFIVLDIKGFKFSLSFFVITVIVLKIFLFH